MAVLLRLIVVLCEVIAHGNEAVVVKPEGVSLGSSLGQWGREKILGWRGANLSMVQFISLYITETLQYHST